MKVLMLAPQPFFQERGTPIAVRMLLQVLSERGDQVDVVTYHEGEDVSFGNVSINRIMSVPFVHGVPPGFSWKKLVSDAVMFGKALRMASRGRYQIVHAVEEAALIALALKWTFKLPYVYDMDSSFARQMIEKYPRLTIARKPLNFLERLVVRNAVAVVPVCDALADVVDEYRPEKVVVLNDVSLLNESVYMGDDETLREELDIEGPMLMYVGNLEGYQGIDLLLDSFALAQEKTENAALVIIGGKPDDIVKYQNKSRDLGIDATVHFIGPRPLDRLAVYLSQADILMSPRVKGQNTPMKLYSYLHSGKAVLATDMPTHTQVLNSRVAMLAGTTPESYSEGIVALVNDEELRHDLGQAGRRLIETRHTYSAFRTQVNGLYEWLSSRVVRTVTT